MKILADDETIKLGRQGFVTNYPPYGHWRGRLVDDYLKSPGLNLYIHTPFCVQRCAYCHYKTMTVGGVQKNVDAYIEALCREIALVSRRFALQDRNVDTLYLGGGTPTLLSESHFDKIFSTIEQYFKTGSSEVTVEAEPITLTAEKARLLQRFGVNRISIGIQSFSDEIIARTGRRDTERQALAAIELARSTGAVVNIDLLSGLVGERMETWEYSVARALEVDVDCITIYKVQVHANTSYYAGIHEHSLELPGDEEELAFMRRALVALDEKGYRPFTFFTFGKHAGCFHEHIANRWLGEDLYSVGISAFGQAGPWVFQNTNSMDRYLQALGENELPLFRAYRLSTVDQLVRDVLLGMKLVEYDARRYKERHGVDLLSLCGDELARLGAQGLLTLEDGVIRLTTAGILSGDHVGRALAASLKAALGVVDGR